MRSDTTHLVRSKHRIPTRPRRPTDEAIAGIGESKEFSVGTRLESLQRVELPIRDGRFRDAAGRVVIVRRVGVSWMFYCADTMTIGSGTMSEKRWAQLREVTSDSHAVVDVARRR